MKRTYLILVGMAAALALLAACSDDDDKPKDGAADTVKFDIGTVDDTSTPDTTVVPDTGVADAGESNFGEKCQGKSQCKPGSPVCMMVLGSTLSICTRTCTPDDTGTPLINEDDCSNGFICASFRLTNNKTYNYCLQKCTPSATKNPCPPAGGTTCTPWSSAFGGQGQAVCYEPACKTDKDCPVLSAKNCSLDADCSAVGTGAFCDKNNGHVCALPGKCTPGGLCGKHTAGKPTAQVGDPCTSDLDCPDGGRCMQSDSGSSYLGTHYNNGYCIIAGCQFATEVPEYACPAGSACFKMYYEGYCHKSCTAANASECRGFAGDKGGDYDCYAWEQLSFDGTSPASKTPICASGANISCDWFSGGGSTTCATLGGTTNTTNMSCRDRFTGVKKSTNFDKTGICLDDTASGPFQSLTDAGVPDSSPVVDAGSVDSAPAVDAGTPDTTPAVDAATPDAAPAVDAATVH